MTTTLECILRGEEITEDDDREATKAGDLAEFGGGWTDGASKSGEAAERRAAERKNGRRKEAMAGSLLEKIEVFRSRYLDIRLYFTGEARPGRQIAAD